MSRWTPCKRRDFIRKLRKLGFEGPYSGTRHQFMVWKQNRQFVYLTNILTGITIVHNICLWKRLMTGLQINLIGEKLAYIHLHYRFSFVQEMNPNTWCL